MDELEENMLFAHRDRGKRALAELEAAAKAPALFKPEWSERASRDLDAARAGADLWST
jgi:hypothetical protein